MVRRGGEWYERESGTEREESGTKKRESVGRRCEDCEREGKAMEERTSRIKMKNENVNDFFVFQ